MARRDLAPRLIDATVHRFEPLAPDWLVRVVAPKKAPVPWPDMVRVAVSVTVPLAVGMLAGQVGIGSFAAMGALLGAFGDAGGPFGRRFRRALIGLVCALVGLLAGRLLLTQGLAAVPVAAAFGVISALLSGISAEFSFGGLQLLVYLAIAAGPAHAAPLPVLVAAIVAGAAWSMLLSFVQTLVVPVEDRPPLAVAAVLSELIALLTLLGGQEAPDEDAVRTARRRISIAVGRAYDVIAAARATAPGRRRDLRRLTGVLAAVTQLAAVAADAARRDPEEVAAAVPEIRALQDRVARRRRPPAAAPPSRPGRTGSALARAMEQLEKAGGEGDARIPGSSRETPARRRPGGGAHRPEDLAVRGAPRPHPRRSGAGDAAAAPRSSLLAAAHHGGRAEARLRLGVRPRAAAHPRHARRRADRRGRAARRASRAAAADPRRALRAAVPVRGRAATSGCCRPSSRRSCCCSSSSAARPPPAPPLGRLLDTVLGAAVVLLVGYLPWPETWRLDIEGKAAAALDALADYAARSPSPIPRPSSRLPAAAPTAPSPTCARSCRARSPSRRRGRGPHPPGIRW